jgi:hypothetical protein
MVGEPYPTVPRRTGEVSFEGQIVVAGRLVRGSE